MACHLQSGWKSEVRKMAKAIDRSESQKFDTAMAKILSVSHEELQRREEEWKKQRKRRKRTKA